MFLFLFKVKKELVKNSTFFKIQNFSKILKHNY
jgi:hypothetical protein